MKSLTAFLYSLILALGAAEAAPTEAPMRVVLVQSAEPGCEPDCPHWIAAQGYIDAGALGQFKRVLEQAKGRKLPILIDSAGGSVETALTIGRLVRAKGLDVSVTKTLFAPCPPSGRACKKDKAAGAPPALPQQYSSKCASACVFILAAGTRRFVDPGAFVGVHQLKTVRQHLKIERTYRVTTQRTWGVPVGTQKTLVSERRIAGKTVQMPTAQTAYDKVNRYFVEIGIGENVMPLLMSATNANVHWLTGTELRATRLATDFLSGEHLVSGAAPTGGAAAGDDCRQFGGFTVGCSQNVMTPDPNGGVPSVLLPSLLPGSQP